MKCTKCNFDVPSSYMKCPNCGQGFHGTSSASSFDLMAQKPKPPMQNSGSQHVNINTTYALPGNPSQSNTVCANNYATFLSRFLAALVDGCIVIVPAAIIGGVMGVWGMLWDDDQYITTLKIQFVTLIFSFIYEAIFLSGAWMATPGKRLLGIKVTNMVGQPISFWRGVGRSASKLISSIFFIGYIMAAFTKNKQALHDLMAGTLVIKG
jgi:uncharacterized RDD family membrane protein YckC